MVGFLKALFGRGKAADEAEPEPGEPVEYRGYRIRPAPYPSNGQHQTAGLIEKDFPDGTKSHRFVRAETHPSRDAAMSFAVTKGRQIIDEQGDRVFEARHHAPSQGAAS